MATLAEMVARVNDNVFSAYPAERPWAENLSGTYTDSATTFDVADGGMWTTGDILENYDQNEQMRVVSVSTNTLTVVRAINGTTAAAGVAGDLLRKNPKVSREQMEQSLDEITKDLRNHGVYNIDTTTITLDQTAYIYSKDLGDLVQPPGVLSVYYVDPSTSVLVPIPFQLVQNAATGALAAGEGLRIAPGEWDSSVSTGYISKAVAYSAVTELPDYLVGPVILGATGRVLGKFISPALLDPGHLSNRTVPPGQAARDARWYQGEFITSVRRIAAMLAAQDHGLGSIRTNRAQRWRR